jgi:hypothetical protein
MYPYVFVRAPINTALLITLVPTEREIQQTYAYVNA